MVRRLFGPLASRTVYLIPGDWVGGGGYSGISGWGFAAGKNVKILSSTCTFVCHNTSYTTNAHHFFLRTGRQCHADEPQ